MGFLCGRLYGLQRSGCCNCIVKILGRGDKPVLEVGVSGEDCGGSGGSDQDLWLAVDDLRLIADRSRNRLDGGVSISFCHFAVITQ